MPRRLTTEEFREKLAISHPNLELLSEYITTNRPVVVRCKTHNYTYTTTPHRLVYGNNCRKCYDDRRGEALKHDIDEVRDMLSKVHDDKYQYPKLKEEYHNNKSKLTIVCPVHGEFKQSFNKHHDKKHGCPFCSESHLERDVYNILKEKGIDAVRQYSFDELKPMTLDFYLPQYNLAIECQGEQHFKPIEAFGGKQKFEKRLERDERKNRICKENNVELIYVTNKRYSRYIEKIDLYKNCNVYYIEDGIPQIFNKKIPKFSK